MFVTGYYGFGNAGDEAILETLLRHLRALRSDLAFTITSADPAETAAAYGVDSVLWSDSGAILEAIRSSSLVLIGGGGIFHDYWGFDPHTLLTDDHWGISFYTGPALLGALLGKRVMLYAIGVGPLFSEHARQYTRIACEAAHVITVRDSASAGLLTELDIPPQQIQLTADPAFDFAVPPAPAPTKSQIGIGLRNWNIGVYPDFWERQVAAALDQFLDTHPGEAVFLPFQRLDSDLEDDLAVARRVYGRMRNQDRCRVVDARATPSQLASEIAACDLVLGMRLHASILAAAARVPVVSLSYDTKVDEAMQRVALEDLTVDIRSVDAGLLAAKLKSAYVRRQELRADLASRMPAVAAEARRNAEIAIGLLDSEANSALSPAMIGLMGESLQRNVRGLSELRQENRRLFHEFEFYQRQTQTLSERVESLEQQAARLTDDEVQTRRTLEDQLTRVRNEANFLRGQLEQVIKSQQHTEETLRSAEDLRARVLRGLDRFQKTFEGNLATYRSQRAWRVMLWIRKAYWLLANRGLASFCTWALSGSPNIDDLELAFPQVWNYMPERLEVPGAAASEAPAPPNAEPVDLSTWFRPQRYDVIILAIFDFEFRFQRPQQIAAELARRGRRVFWVSPARVLAPDAVDPYEAIPLRENLWEVHLRGRRPDLYTGVEPPDARLLESLRHLYRDFTIAESCAILQFPHWRRIGLGLREEFGTRVAYDCMDDWQNWTAEPRISDFNLGEERELARDADVLVVTSQEFYERQKAAGLNPTLARNAADFEFFASPRPNTLLSDVNKPIVGYYGAIADWFDRDLVAYLAESRPAYSFVLIGGVHKVDVSRLEALPNVRFYGEKNYREIPLYLAHFDVALIPFVLNKLTKGVDPVKMYEYFSQGKPVVATEMAELAQSTNLLYIGRTKEDFLAKIDQALSEDDPALRRARVDYAAANTWAARVDAIDRAVQASFPKVSVLVVTYNSREFIKPCLDSVLLNTAAPGLEVIVVDNASTDGTPEIVDAYAQRNPRVKAFPQQQNLGFAGGNNEAVRQASGEYLVFLNADTIVPPGWLERLLRPCYRDTSIGAVAAVTNFSGNETKINVDYQGVAEMIDFARALAQEKAGVTTEIPMAPLYCVLIPRKVWDVVGELDTSFGLGMFEDDDYSMRIRQAGYRVIAAEDAFIHHFGNGSFAKLPSEQSLQIFDRNKKRYEAKWGVTWQKHKMRPGVRPPFEELRLEPAEFLIVREEAGQRSGAAAAGLTCLHPASCRAGAGFNVQPDGCSALVVECERATPSTVILWNGTMLQTAYGNTRMLSAVVPPELYAKRGIYPVRLSNDFGESNVVEFEVLGAAEK